MTVHTYTTHGTCAKLIVFDINEETNIINSVSFTGGCQGNLSALSKMLVGRTKGEVISLFKGMTCGKKPTSCMDQLTKALEEA